MTDAFRCKSCQLPFFLVIGGNKAGNVPCKACNQQNYLSAIHHRCIYCNTLLESPYESLDGGTKTTTCPRCYRSLCVPVLLGSYDPSDQVQQASLKDGISIWFRCPGCGFHLYGFTDDSGKNGACYACAKVCTVPHRKKGWFG